MIPINNVVYHSNRLQTADLNEYNIIITLSKFAFFGDFLFVSFGLRRWTRVPGTFYPVGFRFGSSVFFFANLHILATTSYRLSCTFWRLLFSKNTYKFSARSARLVLNTVWREKHPFGGFGPTIRKSKNFSSCFFLLPVCVGARSAPKFSFFPWDFSSETVSERR